MMLYQDEFIKSVDRFNLDTLPRTIMLEGLKGSGKHTLVDYISQKFNLKVKDITEELNIETIDNISLTIEPHIYLIDSDKITEKQENVILKFLEEPLKNSYIFLLTTNRNNLLGTISNRCYKLVIPKYSREILKNFITKECNVEMLLNIAKTPGDIIELQEYNLQPMFELADKIVSKIKKASYANILKIPMSIGFKNEKDKFDIIIFSKILLYCAYELTKNDTNRDNLIVYNITNKYYNNLYIKNIDKKYLFENYLFELKSKLVEG